MNPSNNSTSEAFEALKEYMVTHFNAKIASGGKEIVKRCHFCGDSRDPSDRHLYIGINKGFIKYNCFKCNARGIVDAKFLRDLDCYDTGLINLCVEQNKPLLYSNSNKYGTLSNLYLKNMVIPLSYNEFAQKKLEYLSNRLGYIFTSSDAAKFKIVLNLKDFLDINGINNYTRHPDLINLIDMYFIGFLSMDNKYVIMRRLIPEGKLPKQIDTRYLNYNIFGTSDDALKYYTIPTTIDIYKPLDIHIAEGVFDILSIYLNVAPIGGNAIYAAICGKSYLNIVKFFIINYGFMKFNLHLYPDADIDFKQMKMIKNEIDLFGINCFVHRNVAEGQKDYGVQMNQIIDKVTKL